MLPFHIPRSRMAWQVQSCPCRGEKVQLLECVSNMGILSSPELFTRLEDDLEDLLAGDPLALASALRKMKSEDSGLFARILGRGKISDQASLWRTHPQTSDRIKRILSLLGQGQREEMPSGRWQLDSLPRNAQWCNDAGC